ncbi:MAG TPA: cytochrome c oxidase subunit I [Opitutus sp.]|nr:cytochrome c oxidase subunit I [Opitutus sp.]
MKERESMADAALRPADRLQIDYLEATWSRPSGLIGWLSTTDHKEIGRRFVATAFGFFVAAGILAALMRLQLSRPEAGLLNPDLYNQVFSMHGTTMMFLFAVPVMQAMGIYLVPLMIGTRNLAFPRLTAFGYYVYLFGGLMLYGAFFLNTGVEAGWFSYVPLAGPDFSPGKRTDFYAQMITFTELSAMVEAVNLIATIFKMRAPGMTLNRMPLFVWAILVTSFMVVFAMPTVATASTMLILDRLVSTQFFNHVEGGDALLWQHLFWFFGHPEVYIIFLPATGMVSAIIVPFMRRAIVGYLPVVLALIATAFAAFGLWVHHMFATGMPKLGQSFFTAASMLIALPSGTQIFCWIATLWLGRPWLKTPLLFVLGFVFTFVMGGLTGVMLASVPLDLQVHDTYFVVAHFHYVLIGGAVFPLFGAFYYWFPKAYGRVLSERIGRWNFALMFAGFHLTFFPMHVLGLEGMPRRVYSYLPDSGWASLNLLASVGAALMATSVALFMANVIRALRRPADAAANPWDAEGLEWATTSPPAVYNFADLPVVRGRYALWEPGEETVVTGLRRDKRLTLVTHVLDAQPDHKMQLPEPSIWPFWSAVAVSALFIGSIFTPWAVVWGSLPVFVTMVCWFWPKRSEE